MSGSRHAPPALGHRLDFRSRVIMVTFGLEVDSAVRMSPEVRDGIATMATTGHQLQTSRTLGVRARFTCGDIGRKKICSGCSSKSSTPAGEETEEEEDDIKAQPVIF